MGEGPEVQGQFELPDDSQPPAAVLRRAIAHVESLLQRLEPATPPDEAEQSTVVPINAIQDLARTATPPAGWRNWTTAPDDTAPDDTAAGDAAADTASADSAPDDTASDDSAETADDLTPATASAEAMRMVLRAQEDASRTRAQAAADGEQILRQAREAGRAVLAEARQLAEDIVAKAHAQVSSIAADARAEAEALRRAAAQDAEAVRAEAHSFATAAAGEADRLLAIARREADRVEQAFQSATEQLSRALAGYRRDLADVSSTPAREASPGVVANVHDSRQPDPGLSGMSRETKSSGADSVGTSVDEPGKSRGLWPRGRG